MVIGFFSDLHATTHNPPCRTDKMMDTLKSKYLQMSDIFDREGCKAVIQAGDFFDSAKEPYHLVNWFLDFHNGKWANYKILGVAGQHDMVNHTLDLENTPYKCLVNAGVLFHLGKEPFRLDGIHVYGRSWGEQTPIIKSKKAFNILVIHETLVKEKIWEGQANVKFGDDFVRKHEFDLIIAGDNHSPFISRYRSKLLVMCGSVLRLKVNQHDYQPCAYTFDTEEKKLKKHPLKIENVVQVEEHKEQKKRKLNINNFISLLDRRANKVDFVSSVVEEAGKLNEKAVAAEVTSIIDTVTRR